MVSKIIFATNYSTVTTTTCYNAAGQPLSTVLKQLISQLSSTLESKSVFVSERGLTSTQWSEYSGYTKRIQYSAVPTSDITAEAVTVDGNVTLHQRYIYRGYLQIACIDLTRAAHPALWYIMWDATQPVATRPLAIQKDGTWYTYGWDLTKNICELYGQHGYIRTAYTYTPYGQVTATGDTEQPIQWSSEFNDTELGLVYYNYRHYNPVDGRWTGRDRILEAVGNNLYAISGITYSVDILGCYSVERDNSKTKNPKADNAISIYEWVAQDNIALKLFSWWIEGNVTRVTSQNDEFSDYLKNYQKIRECIGGSLAKEILKDETDINIRNKAIELDNGYATGYGLLHIPNPEFTISGKIRNKSKYNACDKIIDVKFTWYDRIAPNPKYGLDKKLMQLFPGGNDYDISISWAAQIELKQISFGVYKTIGYADSDINSYLYIFSI